MLPSSTVENYLKAIFQGQSALPADVRLVPMGSVASALGVTPGTATTMVKALAESGLAEYEPYSGVRLTAAGERLAGLVLRRHRLVELFLVQVMGMSWAEVHDEAEQLEHVVSERLIDRIDDMLGRPTHDPHGDPIPTPEGAIAAAASRQPADVPGRHARSSSRASPIRIRSFLRFIEKQRSETGTGDRSRDRATPRPTRCCCGRDNRRADHDRHARRIEAAGRDRASALTWTNPAEPFGKATASSRSTRSRVTSACRADRDRG